MNAPRTVTRATFARRLSITPTEVREGIERGVIETTGENGTGRTPETEIDRYDTLRGQHRLPIDGVLP